MKFPFVLRGNDLWYSVTYDVAGAHIFLCRVERVIPFKGNPSPLRDEPIPRSFVTHRFLRRDLGKTYAPSFLSDVSFFPFLSLMDPVQLSRKTSITRESSNEYRTAT